MNIKLPYNIIIDSKGNKYCLYYKESAIYCIVCDINNIIKETMLINKVYDYFICTISNDDIIYVLCEARNKDILLFINDDYGWHMNEISAFINISYMLPIEIFYLNDSIHIIYCSKLPIANYYNVHHAVKKKDNWEINNICKLFSKKINYSLPNILIKNKFMNMVCTFFDGKQLSLKHYMFDSLLEKWTEEEIVNLYDSDLRIKLLSTDKHLYLICYTVENNVLTFFIFKKDLSIESPFLLLDINKIELFNDKGLIVFELKEQILVISYLENNKLQKWNYDIQKKNLINEMKIPINYNATPLTYVKLIKNENLGVITKKEIICIVNEYLDMKETELGIENIKSINKGELAEKKGNNSTDYIINRIDLLSDKISELDEKLIKLITNNHGDNKDIPDYEQNEYFYYDKEERMTLKDSNFKERFMKAKPMTFKLNNNLLSNEGLVSPNNTINNSFNDNNSSIKVEEISNNDNELLNSKTEIKENITIANQKKENKLLKIIENFLK